MGGAWEMALVVRSRNVESKASIAGGTTAKVIELKEARCTAEGCKNGACIVGMVLQQSWP